MNIQCNDLTRQRLEESLAGRSGVFKLIYDTEDCGCNGHVVVLVIDQPLPTDILVQEEPFYWYVDRQQEQQFDDVMYLEADPGYPSFTLRSDGSLFSKNVRIRDKRQS